MSELRELYGSIKAGVDGRLREFAALGAGGGDLDLWTEACFCSCTPQNNAKKAWEAVCEARRSGLLTDGGQDAVAALLRERGVRFHNHKAAYIRKNRTLLYPQTKAKLNCFLSEASASADGVVQARNDLARVVSGWGMKEASHFLRNIGRGDEVCILDRHILRRLHHYKVINAVPASLPLKLYLEIEKNMIEFADTEGIPVAALDLVFWYEAKGEIFK
jgi:N-glycosylase/DNA lyase